MKIYREGDEAGKVFYGLFFCFAYILPLGAVCVLYGRMIKRLLSAGRPGGAGQSAEALRNKRRVTRLIVIVVAMFAVCWMPIQLILMLQFFFRYPETTTGFALKIVANCLSYANHCINPVIYAFFSENFRRSFYTRLCCCMHTAQPRSARRNCELTTLPARRDDVTVYERLKTINGNTNVTTLT
jgi:allatostatin receptor